MITGCFVEPSAGFNDSRSDVMNEIKIALDVAGIPYTAANDGTIFYHSKYKEEIELIRDKVEEELSGGVLQKISGDISSSILVDELTSRNIKFHVEDHDSEQWVRWHPQNEEQKEEIHLAVVERTFKIKRNEY